MALRRCKEVLTIIQNMQLDNFTRESISLAVSELSLEEIEDFSNMLRQMSYIIDELKIKVDMNPYNAISMIADKARLIQFKREDKEK